MTGLILVTGGTGPSPRCRVCRVPPRRHLAADHAVGRVTFEEFLAERFGRA